MTGEDTNQLYYWRLLIKRKGITVKATRLGGERRRRKQGRRIIHRSIDKRKNKERESEERVW